MLQKLFKTLVYAFIISVVLPKLRKMMSEKKK